MNYVIGASGVSRWCGESKKVVCEKSNIDVTASGVHCGLVKG